jgi:PknH-like extracellular domain
VSTIADANALFVRFSEQWKQCDGKTLTAPSSSFVENAITDARVKDSVVAASVSKDSGEQSILHAVPEVRAVGVRGNCLVEVEVAFVGSTDLTDQPSAKTSAVDIAHAMMDKVSALS